MRFALLCVAAVFALSGAVRLKLVNATGGWDIHEVYAVPAASEEWGEDLLDGSVMAQGGSFSLELAPGLYSLKAVDEDGDDYVRSPVVVTSDLVWSITLDDLEGYSGGGGGGG